MTENTPNLEGTLHTLRPALHRYCARMTGSIVDGEDVVQETMLKAFAARDTLPSLDDPQSWLFRIAHNAALDHLRRRKRARIADTDDVLDALAADDEPAPGGMTASVRTFLRLPPLPRSAVILKDVLGHSIEEITAIIGANEPAVKSALHRGRMRLREIAAEPEDVELPMLTDALRERLVAFVEGFKTGDFDAVRAMLADDVRLDLVAKLERRGRHEVGEYLGRYAAATQWAFAAGVADGRAAMLVFDRDVSLEVPAYFVALELENGRVTAIRDFLFARYAMEGLDALALGAP